MKIAYVSATFPPYWAGTGNVAYHNARIMHARGHDVTMFTASVPEPLAMPFKTVYLPASLRLGNAPLTLGLYRALQGFDLIHLHYPYIFGAELTALAAWRQRTPWLLTYHNQLQEQTALKRLLFALYNRSAEPLLLRAAHKLAGVSREHLLSVHPRLRDDPRLCAVPNGVDCEVFRPDPEGAAAWRARLGVAADAPLVLFVGALDQAHRFKNVPGLLQAFAQQGHPEAVLWIVGDGDLRPGLAVLAERLGLQGRVHFLGKHPPEALAAIYSAATVTVLPSTAVESFGVVLIESMACATPVIASALPGVRGVVAEEKDGLLCPPGDVAALAAALTRLLEDSSQAQRMGFAGLEKVQQHYAWSAIAHILETLYQEVLGARAL